MSLTCPTLRPASHAFGALGVAWLLVACGGGGGGGGDSAAPPPPPPALPTVTSIVVDPPTYGQPLLITIAGANLDLGITVTSAGCSGIARLTSGANVSTAVRAFYACTPTTAGAQEVKVQRSSDGTTLGTAAYTVRVPQVTTATATVRPYPQKVLITLEGSDLDQGLTVASTGCSGLALSTTAPEASTATRAYYTCAVTGYGDQQVTLRRALDGTSLPALTFTVPAPTVTAAATANVRYSQSMLLTLTGTGLDQGLAVSSAGCFDPTPSTRPGETTTATTAYFRCTITTTGAQTLQVRRLLDNTALPDVAYTVPVPQVTLTFDNGAGAGGSVVVTLEPAKAPVTTNNFLAYVASGFYVGTVIHRNAPGFVLQGGGYTGPLTSSSDPVPKTTGAPIVLEDGAGLSNLRYTLAMARTALPDTATSQFFVNLADNTFLDKTDDARGYAVFGTIVSGTAVIDTMTRAPCVPWLSFLGRTDECLPLPNLVITAAEQTR